eukprot:TRINITY_DN17668_c0_g1_i1.p1 TRINITY_DN17668_c0_g1~~TRINITY_DN17668_c0_g1_i1.p1  ORF type:complete len:146 (-),score=30.09 TRINITY_DN17668_c0_g1_i1:51-488(-)
MIWRLGLTLTVAPGRQEEGPRQLPRVRLLCLLADADAAVEDPAGRGVGGDLLVELVDGSAGVVQQHPAVQVVALPGADEAEALELRGGVGAQRHHPDVVSGEAGAEVDLHLPVRGALRLPHRRRLEVGGLGAEGLEDHVEQLRVL